MNNFVGVDIFPFIISFTCLLVIACIREVLYLLLFLHYKKGINGSAFHSFTHIIILILIPLITVHSVIFSEDPGAMYWLLIFMGLIVFHMYDERKEYFGKTTILTLLKGKNKI